MIKFIKQMFKLKRKVKYPSEVLGEGEYNAYRGCVSKWYDYLGV